MSGLPNPDEFFEDRVPFSRESRDSARSKGKLEFISHAVGVTAMRTIFGRWTNKVCPRINIFGRWNLAFSAIFKFSIA